MRTPTWETSPGALVALLNSGAPLNKADLYTVTLAGGTQLRWSGADVALTVNGKVFTLGPGIIRNRLRWVTGVEVSTLDLTITDNIGTTVNGVPLIPFVRSRGLFGARVLLERAFWGHDDAGPVGVLHWFAGRAGEADLDRYHAQLSVVSDLALLDVMVPRDVYQPGCLNTLFDGLCGASRAAFTVTGAATSASSSVRTTFSHALAQAEGWFDLGVITMTSGAATGHRRTVRRHTSSTLQVLQPWPAAIADGDTFSITPGCDKTLATCEGKFSNKPRFRGQPFIPVAETVT